MRSSQWITASRLVVQMPWLSAGSPEARRVTSRKPEEAIIPMSGHAGLERSMLNSAVESIRGKWLTAPA